MAAAFGGYASREGAVTQWAKCPTLPDGRGSDIAVHARTGGQSFSPVSSVKADMRWTFSISRTIS
jgi:hypothetical protein